jgi:hypothetical protein
MNTITLKDYDNIPVMYNEDGDFVRMGLDVGDYYIMRERDDLIERGMMVSVYEVVRITKTGHESKYTMLRIE